MTNSNLCETYAINQVLKGKRIIVTREKKQSQSMCKRIHDYGGTCIQVPLISYTPVSFSPKEKEELLADVEQATWVIFTSQNAFHFFIELVPNLSILEDKHIAVVGDKTAAYLKSFGLEPDLSPKRFTSRALYEQILQEVNGQETSFFIPVSQMANQQWIQDLRKKGYQIKSKTIYHTVKNEASKQLLRDCFHRKVVDVVTLASSSAVTFFVQMVQELNLDKFSARVIYACIGSKTAAVAKKYGLAPIIVPKKYTTNTMIDAVCQYYMEE
ncbi:uroporphyrinogen-III synthase [Terrilactibacillus laevilacticus]|uniref:Uroporphyrinogen-III synthase n=1 Tax=Terrilactibacillus laevilacticus TaxID=1380157 RepID=A0ABW5PU27_9BACI|nr:uroporphyrinogen-III synthase [Terrilactibacillus laevilacticus]